MTKRSHQIASRQAAVSRERKKKKRLQPSEKNAESPSVSVNVAASYAGASPSIAPAPAHNVSTKSSQSVQLDENRYQYVLRDLRKIAIIAAPLIIILIILAFVL